MKTSQIKLFVMNLEMQIARACFLYGVPKKAPLSRKEIINFLNKYNINSIQGKKFTKHILNYYQKKNILLLEDLTKMILEGCTNKEFETKTRTAYKTKWIK